MDEKVEMTIKKPFERNEVLERAVREASRINNDSAGLKPYPGQYAYVPTYVSAGGK
jgi:hypothetical protein